MWKPLPPGARRRPSRMPCWGASCRLWSLLVGILQPRSRDAHRGRAQLDRSRPGLEPGSASKPNAPPSCVRPSRSASSWNAAADQVSRHPPSGANGHASRLVSSEMMPSTPGLEASPSPAGLTVQHQNFLSRPLHLANQLRVHQCLMADHVRDGQVRPAQQLLPRLADQADGNGSILGLHPQNNLGKKRETPQSRALACAPSAQPRQFAPGPRTFNSICKNGRSI